jgi:polyisoprenoid-binding protein YceI
MATWKIDKAHSEIKFKVRHLVVSTVTGWFEEFDATVESDSQDFTDAKITFEADVKSIRTKNSDRDQHLKSADFFDAENHPKIKFESKSLKKVKENRYEVTGDMTIRGKTKEIILNVELNGVTTGFGGVAVAGFEIKGEINRFDYGLKWNALTEAGGVVVGENVKLDISAELNKVEVEQLKSAS